jgi:hypothetical protein
VCVGVVLGQDAFITHSEDDDLVPEVVGERAGWFADTGAPVRADGRSSTPIECVDRSCLKVV